MLGQVIVDHQNILALLHKIFAHGAAAVGSDVLQRGKFRSGSGNNNGVIHGAAGGEGFHHLGYGRALLANGHVNAENAVALLVQNGIQCDGSFTGLTVADNQFALTAADGDHAIDGLDAGLQRYGNGLTLDDTGSRTFYRSISGRFDGAFAIDGGAEGIDNAADEGFAYRNRNNTAGTADAVAFFDAGIITQNDDGDGIFFKVLGNAVFPIGEFQQLIHHALVQSGGTSNTIANDDDGTYLILHNVVFVIFDLGFNNFGYFLWSQFHRTTSFLFRLQCVDSRSQHSAAQQAAKFL